METVVPTATRRRTQTNNTKKVAEEAGKAAAREAIMEMQFGEHEDANAAAELEGSTEALNQKRDIGFDIFDNIGHPLAAQGTKVTYVIRKNNELAGTKKHPYSWIQLAKDFGPGDYQVIAKDPNKKYLSSQNQTISEDAEVFAEEDETPAPQQPAPGLFQQPTNGMSFIEMMNFMQTSADRVRQEANQQATQQANSQVAMITAMTEMMKNQQLQGQNLFMETTKLISAVTEKLSANQERMMEKMQERMDKIAELAVKKPEGPGWLEIMKMQSESQNKGFELFEKITKLAELKAEEQIAMIESSRDDKPANKSMTDTLIETILPVIATSMVQNNQANQLALAHAGGHPTAPRALPPGPAQPRGSIRQRGPQKVHPANGQVQPRPQAQHAKAPGAGPQNPQRANKEGGGSVASSGKGFGGIFVNPKAKQSPPPKSPVVEVVDTKTQEDVTLADKVEVLNGKGHPSIKEKCNEILPVFLGTLMIDAIEPVEASKRTITFLGEQGISREDFISNVTIEELLAKANEFNLPTEAHAWLNEVYANIQSQPGDDARGKSRASGEHSTPSRSEREH